MDILLNYNCLILVIVFNVIGCLFFFECFFCYVKYYLYFCKTKLNVVYLCKILTQRTL